MRRDAEAAARSTLDPATSFVAEFELTVPWPPRTLAQWHYVLHLLDSGYTVQDLSASAGDRRTDEAR